MPDKKRIAILGSTGSIGRQALEVIQSHPGLFEAEVLTAKDNLQLLIQQAIEFRPSTVVIANENLYHEVSDALAKYDIKVFCGADAVAQVTEMGSVDLVLNALVGFAGFMPTVHAVKAGKTLALANKESLVVGGGLIRELVKENKAAVIPVDSEHSAIFQCLVGEPVESVDKLILTASGGPFRERTSEELEHVKLEEALRHPNWDMGAKITIDSATLMNKGLEVIEARWLFDISPDRIEVVIHPQSIIHSMVKFIDGSLKAQLGLPDMRIPIGYALSYPERLFSGLPEFSFDQYPELSFLKPDTKKFRNLALAFEALKTGGNAPCVLNAANEVAVDAFLNSRIRFLEMPDIIEKSLEKVSLISKPSLQDLHDTDAETRKLALNLIRRPIIN